MVQWYLIPMVSSKQAPASFNQSLNMFFTQNPKSTWVLKCNINTKTKIHFTIHNFQSIRIKTLLQNPNDPSAVFVNENALNIEQSRFVKQISWMQKSITLPNFEQKHIECNAGNTNAFQSYNSSILQILQDQTNPVEQAAYNNDVLPF
jgi:hypothetical protein